MSRSDKEIREIIRGLDKRGKIKKDLISRETVLEIIKPRLDACSEGSLEYQVLHPIFTSVQELPVIYDVDKVIDEMEEGIEDNTDCETGVPCDNWVIDMCNDLITHCILIAQAGYLEEE